MRRTLWILALAFVCVPGPACDFAPLSGRASWHQRDEGTARAYAADKLFGSRERPRIQRFEWNGRAVVVRTWREEHSGSAVSFHLTLNGKKLEIPADQSEAGAFLGVRSGDSPLEVTIYSRLSRRYRTLVRTPEHFLGAKEARELREAESDPGFNALIGFRYRNGRGKEHFVPVTY